MPSTRTAGLWLILAMIGPASARQVPSRSQIPGFRSGTDLVQVNVSVLDNHREPVRGLTADDFIVLEDGKPRPVDAFAAIDVPTRLAASNDAAWTRNVPPDVTTNQVAAAGGRIVVILMDRSIPVGTPTMIARKTAAAAVDALGPGDLAALISTSGAVPQNLTADRARLLAVINQPRDWSTDSSDEAKEVEAAVGISGPAFSNLADGRCLCGLCVLETITNVARALEDVPRQQKALLFIGSDITFQVGPQTTGAGAGSSLGEIGCAQRLTDARTLMNAALDRSGVIVHSFDPTGLQPTGPTGRASSTVRGIDVGPSFSTAVNQSLQRLGNLQVLPARTGGRVIANTNDPEDHVPAIIRESESYYLLGYRPAESQVPGQTRKIEVKVRRRDVTVSARRQYVVPSAATNAVVEATSAKLGDAMRAPVPAADIPLSIAASSFASPGGTTAAVAVALDVSSIADQAVAPGGTRAALEIAVASYDMRGRPDGAIEVVSVTDLPARHGRRLEALARLDLRPGDHELRATVVAPDTGRAASVFTYVTVPPFGSNPLTLSHIAMTAPADTDTIRRERVSSLLPVVPTTVREFPRTAPVSAFMQVYQGLDRQDAVQPVAITATVVDRAGVTRVREILPLTVAAFRDRRTADCRVTLPVSRLEPGEYLLTLEASTAAHAAGRAIRFNVE